jgi:hypothetical protein
MTVDDALYEMELSVHTTSFPYKEPTGRRGVPPPRLRQRLFRLPYPTLAHGPTSHVRRGPLHSEHTEDASPEALRAVAYMDQVYSSIRHPTGK